VRCKRHTGDLVIDRLGGYEVDHLVQLAVGGSNQLANLVPQPASPRPGFPETDRLENAIHDGVCERGDALGPLQWRVPKDWVALYRDLVSSRAARPQRWAESFTIVVEAARGAYGSSLQEPRSPG